MQFLICAEMQMVVECVEICLEIRDGMALWVGVVDAETAADIDGAECDTFCAIFVLQAVDTYSAYNADSSLPSPVL